MEQFPYNPKSSWSGQFKTAHSLRPESNKRLMNPSKYLTKGKTFKPNHGVLSRASLLQTKVPKTYEKNFMMTNAIRSTADLEKERDMDHKINVALNVYVNDEIAMLIDNMKHMLYHSMTPVGQDLPLTYEQVTETAGSESSNLRYSTQEHPKKDHEKEHNKKAKTRIQMNAHSDLKSADRLRKVLVGSHGSYSSYVMTALFAGHYMSLMESGKDPIGQTKFGHDEARGSRNYVVENKSIVTDNNRLPQRTLLTNKKSFSSTVPTHGFALSIHYEGTRYPGSEEAERFQETKEANEAVIQSVKSSDRFFDSETEKSFRTLISGKLDASSSLAGTATNLPMLTKALRNGFKKSLGSSSEASSILSGLDISEEEPSVDMGKSEVYRAQFGRRPRYRTPKPFPDSEETISFDSRGSIRLTPKSPSTLLLSSIYSTPGTSSASETVDSMPSTLLLSDNDTPVIPTRPEQKKKRVLTPHPSFIGSPNFKEPKTVKKLSENKIKKAVRVPGSEQEQLIMRFMDSIQNVLDLDENENRIYADILNNFAKSYEELGDNFYHTELEIVKHFENRQNQDLDAAIENLDSVYARYSSENIFNPIFDRVDYFLGKYAIEPESFAGSVRQLRNIGFGDVDFVFPATFNELLNSMRNEELSETLRFALLFIGEQLLSLTRYYRKKLIEDIFSRSLVDGDTTPIDQFYGGFGQAAEMEEGEELDTFMLDMLEHTGTISNPGLMGYLREAQQPDIDYDDTKEDEDSSIREYKSDGEEDAQGDPSFSQMGRFSPIELDDDDEFDQESFDRMIARRRGLVDTAKDILNDSERSIIHAQERASQAEDDSTYTGTTLTEDSEEKDATVLPGQLSDVLDETEHNLDASSLMNLENRPYVETGSGRLVNGNGEDYFLPFNDLSSATFSPTLVSKEEIDKVISEPYLSATLVLPDSEAQRITVNVENEGPLYQESIENFKSLISKRGLRVVEVSQIKGMMHSILNRSNISQIGSDAAVELFGVCMEAVIATKMDYRDCDITFIYSSLYYLVKMHTVIKAKYHHALHTYIQMWRGLPIAYLDNFSEQTERILSTFKNISEVGTRYSGRLMKHGLGDLLQMPTHLMIHLHTVRQIMSQALGQMMQQAEIQEDEEAITYLSRFGQTLALIQPMKPFANYKSIDPESVLSFCCKFLGVPVVSGDFEHFDSYKQMEVTGSFIPQVHPIIMSSLLRYLRRAFERAPFKEFKKMFDVKHYLYLVCLTELRKEISPVLRDQVLRGSVPMVFGGVSNSSSRYLHTYRHNSYKTDDYFDVKIGSTLSRSRLTIKDLSKATGFETSKSKRRKQQEDVNRISKKRRK